MSYNYLPKRIKWEKCECESFTSEEVSELCSRLSVTENTAKLLAARGYKSADLALEFIYCDNSEFFDPFCFSQMKNAAERINSALDNGELICVYGDYDVDGITSTALLYSYLRDRGGVCTYYIPKRSGEGYGVCNAVIDSLKEQGVKLIVTVDTGITAADEIEYAISIGIDVVITDHHECHDRIPDCSAAINPKIENDLPFYDFAGVGVSFKLACALEMSAKNMSASRAGDYIFKRYGDLVALGTVADVMPLKGENRLIVERGLKMLRDNPRVGISQLLEKSGISISLPAKEGTKLKTVDSTLVSYTIAPRLNAAGRLDDASLALHLLLAKTESAASADAFKLCQINTERQNLEKETTNEALQIISEHPEMLNDRVIVLAKDGWNNGIIGIVASRLTEKFNRPSILITLEGDTGKGSGRSVKGMNLVSALSSVSEQLIRFGGHELAAGLTIKRENVDSFRRRINEYANECLTDEQCVRVCEYDAEIDLSDVNIRFAHELTLFEPCGVSNEQPVFMIRNCVLSELNAISANRHTKLTLKNENTSVSCVMFGVSPDELDVLVGDEVDVLCNVAVNNFMGSDSVQLIISQIRLNRAEYAVYENQMNIFADVAAGKISAKNKNNSGTLNADLVTPTRSEFALLYNYLKLKKDRRISLRSVCREITTIHLLKLRIMLEIFAQSGLLTLTPISEIGGMYSYEINVESGSKFKLEETDLYKKLI